jgi:ABC-type phosphate/phosphonate transport system substrate-binding protein
VAEEPPLVFGVLNQQSPQLTAERWNPVFNYLGGATGYKFQLRMGQNVQATNAMMARGEFDLVFTNHNFRQEFDGTYKVLARWGNAPIFGVLAVLESSKVRRLKDLNGQRVAYPSQNAFVAYAVPKAALRKAGVAEKEVLAGNQEGALAQLAAGQVEAVGVNSRFLSQYAARNGPALPRNLYLRAVSGSGGSGSSALAGRAGRAHPRGLAGHAQGPEGGAHSRSQSVPRLLPGDREGLRDRSPGLQGCAELSVRR